MERMTASRETLARVAFQGQVGCGDCFDRAHRVALDAGNLHEAADWVVCQSEVMLHRDLGSYQHLLA